MASSICGNLSGRRGHYVRVYCTRLLCEFASIEEAIQCTADPINSGTIAVFRHNTNRTNPEQIHFRHWCSRRDTAAVGTVCSNRRFDIHRFLPIRYLGCSYFHAFCYFHRLAVHAHRPAIHTGFQGPSSARVDISLPRVCWIRRAAAWY